MDSAFLIDLKGRVIAANGVSAKRFGMGPDQFVGTCTYDLMPPELVETRKARVIRVVRTKETLRFQDQRKGMLLDTRACPVLDEQGNVVQIAIFARDITQQEKALTSLQKQKEQLGLGKIQLEEVNTALKVLLKEKDADRADMEENIMASIAQRARPCLERLKNTYLDRSQAVCVENLEMALNEVVSPFARNLSSAHFGLTPSEIQVAHMVKQGRRTKEIARLLNLSRGTIDRYRESIRKKMGLQHQKTKLRTFLSSLE